MRKDNLTRVNEQNKDMGTSIQSERAIFFYPITEDCLGMKASIFEMLNLFKDKPGGVLKKKTLLRANKWKMRSGSSRTHSCPQFVAKCFCK